MKIKTENIYRLALFVPVLLFVREYFFIAKTLIVSRFNFTDFGNSTVPFYSLAVPLLPYLLTILFLLLLSRNKPVKQIYRIFIFAPLTHSAFVSIWFLVFGYLTITNKLPVETTGLPLLISIGAIIVVIPVGYLIMGLVALIYVLLTKFGLIKEEFPIVQPEPINHAPAP